ncbi:hypothetical protein [Schinkia azotoformans]|uniref:hypothetical protein n=2 Tax=Schinkia azotoformans TaxID=1454 RepID=UPI002DBBF4E4|nr:hypothetical protein [Schinkia azotoformans]MEC1716636.1 hypothetical protein [Schinkia azotoformans]MEC1745455.1 hypothetical protein [Schinkia azotoformans]MEC1756518.1 hypothetical protein [Schinkia azotoformans]MEC1785779.1 hypothetical protein [Schinkia azotoformans]
MKMNQVFICEDCVFVFQIHTSCKDMKKPYCPKCGEKFEVRNYQSVKKGEKLIRIKWKQEELELLDRCISGDLGAHQVAVMTGRTVNSVLKRIPRRKEELKYAGQC